MKGRGIASRHPFQPSPRPEKSINKTTAYSFGDAAGGAVYQILITFQKDRRRGVNKADSQVGLSGLRG